MKFISILTSLALTLMIMSCQTNTESGTSGAIAYTLGHDTTMVQVFSLQGNQLKQTWIQRSPEVQWVEGSATLSEEGHLLELKADYFKPDTDGGKTLLFSSQLKFENDTTFVTTGYGQPQTRAIPGHVMTTNLLKPIGMFWHAQMAYFAPDIVGATRVNAHVVSSRPNDFRLKRLSSNEVSVGSDAMGTYRIMLDDKGQVTEVDGTASSFNFKGQVVEHIDLEKVAQTFLKYEQENGPWRSLTGKGELTTKVGNTQVSIAYGRPFQRGRKIFGGIVPWDKVWRTGANAATKMVTDGPLKLGDVNLEAGEYSIWTIPRANGNWELVINSQANTWGTNHDDAYDLHKIPLQISSPENPWSNSPLPLKTGN